MLIYVYGGSGSGKSGYAEQRIVDSAGPVRYYIATMEPFGEEGNRRIARHRRLREGKGFQTIECPVRLERLQLPEPGAVLVEDLSNLLANEIWSPQGRGRKESDDHTLPERIADACLHLTREHPLVVVVGNDVFCDGAVLTPEMERYTAQLAECQRRIAEAADEVVEVVCGIPLVHHKEE